MASLSLHSDFLGCLNLTWSYLKSWTVPPLCQTPCHIPPAQWLLFVKVSERCSHPLRLPKLENLLSPIPPFPLHLTSALPVSHSFSFLVSLDLWLTFSPFAVLLRLSSELSVPPMDKATGTASSEQESVFPHSALPTPSKLWFLCWQVDF